MTFLIIIIVSDLKNISLKALVITLLLFLVFYSLSSISSYCDRVTVLFFSSILFFLVSFFFLFFPSLFLSLLDLDFLFGLVGFTLVLEGYIRLLSLFILIILRIEAHL